MSRFLHAWPVLRLYILVFCVILPVLCHRMYFSVYYNQYLHMGGMDPNSYSRRVNDDRQRQAEMFIASKQVGHSHTKLHSHTKVKLAIGFVTVNREIQMEDGSLYNPGYLLQTVAAILQEKTSDSTHVLICNVDSDPKANSDAVFLSSVVPVHSRYQQTNTSIPNSKQKEKEDYVYCLNRTLALNPDFVLIIEDDALATKGTLDIICHIIWTKLENRYHGFELVKNNFTKTIIKLFSPLYIQRDFFTTKPKRIVINLLELIGMGIVGGTAISIAHFLLVQKGRRPYMFHCGFFTAACVCCILAALAVSRPHLLEMRKISKHFYIMMEANDCCTPAVLYPKGAALEFMSYLQTKTHGQAKLDGVMDDFVREHGYRQFAVEPNLFSHIGKHSTLHQSKLKFLQNFV